jgi:hypothetical protein
LIPVSHAGTSRSPKPKLKVAVKIKTDDGRTVKAVATNGSMIKLGKDGDVYGLVVAVQDEGKQLVEFTVSRIPPKEGGAPEEIEKLQVEGASAKTTNTPTSFSIEVVRVEKVSDAPAQSTGQAGQSKYADFVYAHFTPGTRGLRPGPPQGRGYQAGDGVCCVSCDDGFTVCANCYVEIVGCGACITAKCMNEGFPS